MKTDSDTLLECLEERNRLVHTLDVSVEHLRQAKASRNNARKGCRTLSRENKDLKAQVFDLEVKLKAVDERSLQELTLLREELALSEAKGDALMNDCKTLNTQLERSRLQFSHDLQANIDLLGEAEKDNQKLTNSLFIADAYVEELKRQVGNGARMIVQDTCDERDKAILTARNSELTVQHLRRNLRQDRGLLYDLQTQYTVLSKLYEKSKRDLETAQNLTAVNRRDLADMIKDRDRWARQCRHHETERRKGETRLHGADVRINNLRGELEAKDKMTSLACEKIRTLKAQLVDNKEALDTLQAKYDRRKELQFFALYGGPPLTTMPFVEMKSKGCIVNINYAAIEKKMAEAVYIPADQLNLDPSPNALVDLERILNDGSDQCDLCGEGPRELWKKADEPLLCDTCLNKERTFADGWTAALKKIARSMTAHNVVAKNEAQPCNQQYLKGWAAALTHQDACGLTFHTFAFRERSEAYSIGYDHGHAYGLKQKAQVYDLAKEAGRVEGMKEGGYNRGKQNGLKHGEQFGRHAERKAITAQLCAFNRTTRGGPLLPKDCLTVSSDEPAFITELRHARGMGWDAGRQCGHSASHHSGFEKGKKEGERAGRLYGQNLGRNDGWKDAKLASGKLIKALQATSPEDGPALWVDGWNEAIKAALSCGAGS